MKVTQKLAEEKMKSPSLCEMDLTMINGDGDFPCPNCGVTISPEDETENVYRILETKVRSDALEEVVIRCNKCECQLRLTGFLSLERENL